MLRKAIREKVAAAMIRTETPRGRGQGVLVPGELILTAAHCLEWTHTGAMVLGDYFPQTIRAGGKKLNTSPLAIEAVSDVAVLGPFDAPECSADYDKFIAFCESTEPIELWLDDPEPRKPFPVYVFTHTRTVVKATAKLMNPHAYTLYVEASEQIKGGTSGGPVVAEDGRLLGVVHSFSKKARGKCDGGVSRPHLTVPPWLLRRMNPKKSNSTDA